METETEPRKLKDCAHCRVNPKATKPFLKMTRIPIRDNLLLQDIEETAKLRKEPSECFVCGLVEDMVNGFEQAFRN
jgi:hypothetical protein